ncbi:MAG: lysine--tRNA ligase [Patescibacteria group bacterium]
MSQVSILKEARFEKLKKIKKAGVPPYPSRATRTHTCHEASLNFDTLINKEIVLVGRLMRLRSHGRLTFFDLVDESGKIQIVFKQDKIGEKNYNFLENLDIGDFLQVEGILFKTKTGEKTLEVKDFKLLSKSLSPLPEKWHGLKDIELRLRKRYLDLMMNPETRRIFQKKSQLIDAIRDFLTDRGFLEVTTPILQPQAGGAEARPFVTHHNVLDIDLYLRIAPELYLKRLICGGFEKIYELGPVFRNEGMSREHLQEFLMLEYYWAYKNFEDLMRFEEEMFSYLLPRCFGTMKFKYQNQELDFTPPWPKIDYRKLVLKETGVDLTKIKNRDKLAAKMKEMKIEFEKNAGFGRLVDILYKQKCRPRLFQPCFLVNHPIAVSPLAKKSERDSEIAERFQVVAAGSELCNAYSELNDPQDQKERFLEQAKLRQMGDEEAHIYDEDFIEALEYGMPPVAGFGMGIERLLVVFMNLDSVREAVFFPQMRPEGKIPKSKLQIPNKSQNSNFKNSKTINPGITHGEALKLVRRLENKNSQKHLLATEAIMRALARHFGEDEEVWGLAGLLYDIDMEDPRAISDMSLQGKLASDQLAKIGVNEIILGAIRAHNEKTGEPRDTLIKKAIFAADPITGLIVASTLVMPSKKLQDVTPQRVLKRFKEKSFAKGANRQVIKSCEEFGLDLEKFVEIGLLAMQKISNDLGL